MIELEFLIDENELRDDIENDPANADLATLTQSYFFMPIRLNINGIEFFNYNHHPTIPWTNAPLLALALYGLDCIKNLPKSKHECLDLADGPQNLLFNYIDGNVLVKYDINNRESIIDYKELLNAFQSFSNDVRKFLNEHIPEMRKHPDLGRWIRGEIEF